jgi:DNA topoisomerase-1
VHDIGSADVNEYLREATGEDFTAKTFRTWAGTVLAACALQEIGPFRSQAHAKRNVTSAVKAVASVLRNTPAVCRNSYVHPAVVDAYLDGALDPTNGPGAGARIRPADFERMEPVVLALLQQREAHAGRRSA